MSKKGLHGPCEVVQYRWIRIARLMWCGRASPVNIPYVRRAVRARAEDGSRKDRAARIEVQDVEDDE